MEQIEHNYTSGNVFKENKSNFEIPQPGEGDYGKVEEDCPW